MTTICFDGHTLAADTRIGTATERRNDSAKIHQFKDVVLVGGHRVVAVGTSGNAVLSRQVISAMRDTPEHAEQIVSVFQNAWKYGPQGDDRVCSLLIVCEKVVQIFTIRYNNGKRITKLQHHDLNTKVAIGSGGNVALMFMRHFQVPSTLAVAAASTVDDATGSFVQAIRITGLKVTHRTEKHYQTADHIIGKLRSHVKKGGDDSCLERKQPSKPRSTKRLSTSATNVSAASGRKKTTKKRTT